MSWLCGAAFAGIVPCAVLRGVGIFCPFLFFGGGEPPCSGATRNRVGVKMSSSPRVHVSLPQHLAAEATKQQLAQAQAKQAYAVAKQVHASAVAALTAAQNVPKPMADQVHAMGTQVAEAERALAEAAAKVTAAAVAVSPSAHTHVTVDQAFVTRVMGQTLKQATLKFHLLQAAAHTARQLAAEQGADVAALVAQLNAQKSTPKATQANKRGQQANKRGQQVTKRAQRAARASASSSAAAATTDAAPVAQVAGTAGARVAAAASADASSDDAPRQRVRMAHRTPDVVAKKAAAKFAHKAGQSAATSAVEEVAVPHEDLVQAFLSKARASAKRALGKK